MGKFERQKGNVEPGGLRPKDKPRTRPAPTTPERVRPAPLTPEAGREGIAGVQANADEAFRELDTIKRAHTEGFELDESQRGIDGRTESRSESRERGFVIDRRFLTRTYRRIHIAKGEGKKKKDIKKEVLDGCGHDLQIVQLQVVTVLTKQKVSLIDPRTTKFLRALNAALPDNFENLETPERLEIIKRIMPKLGIQVAPEVAEKALLDLEHQEGASYTVTGVVNDEKGFDVILEQSDTADPEQAFLEAIKQSSPEVQAQYREYLETWQAESVSAIFTPSEVKGVPVESLPEVALQNAKQIIKTSPGIILKMEEGNYGTIEFGDFTGRCELKSVKGEPKLYIDDLNADSGRRGPIDPSEVRAELAHALIDKFFSEQFRKLVGRGSEMDPQEIADAKLFKIVHAFLPPGSDEHMDRLDATQKSIIINLAILFATPDSKYISLQDKARFLNDLQPDRLAIAKKKLHEQDFPEKFSLSEFDSSLGPR